MNARTIWTVAALVTVSIPSLAQDFPVGWRLPTEKELAGEPLRNASPAKYAKANADFNGDGVPDDAYLLKSTNLNGEALWVRLSSGKGSFRWIKLTERRWPKEYLETDLAMGIDVAPPGVHAYGCFDGVEECNWEPKQRPKLKLRDPSLVYFLFESAASMFFWSNKHKRFLRVWLSD